MTDDRRETPVLTAVVTLVDSLLTLWAGQVIASQQITCHEMDHL